MATIQLTCNELCLVMCEHLITVTPINCVEMLILSDMICAHHLKEVGNYYHNDVDFDKTKIQCCFEGCFCFHMP